MGRAFDVVVIGSGPGGYVAALKARSKGLGVALVEKEKVGGVCLNRGCIPTKTLLHHAEGIQWMRHAAGLGIVEGGPSVNFQALMRHKDLIVQTMTSNLQHQLDSSGIHTIVGTAKVPEPGFVTIDGNETIRAGNIVVATGSRGWVPAIPGSDLPGVLNTRQILGSDKVPAHLTIVGGGMIGQEFACIYAALGAKVTVLEALGRVLGEVDSDMAKRYLTTLPSKGISCETGCRIDRIEERTSGLMVVYEKGSEEKVLQTDMVLMATGRRPDLGACGVDALGVRMEKGAIVVDEFLRTSIPGIRAVGDVLGKAMLAHVASYQAEIVVENIIGNQKPVNDRIVPSAAYTYPQIAWVGLTEDAARAAGLAFRTSVFPLSANGKAFSIDQPVGWVKLLEDSRNGCLVGIHMMGPNVSELLGEATLAIGKGMSAADIVEVIHPHPTVSEALREAALGFCGGPVHAAPRIRSFR